MADDKTEDDNETNIRRGLDVIQSMIDISADRLEGLRTQCATSAELTQQEIRSLETKLVKMFSELLVTKAKLPERLPKGLPATGTELKQWLRVVGLSPDTLNYILQRVDTLESLLEKNDQDIRSILNNNANIRDEEVNRLNRAIVNLKKCRECINAGQKEPKDLFWDSWDRHHHIHHRTGASPRTHRAGIKYQHHPHTRLNPEHSPSGTSGGGIGSPNECDSNTEKITTGGIISPEETSTSTVTPSPSPPNSPSSTTISSRSRNKSGFPTTPPPKIKNSTITVNTPPQIINNNIDPLILTKSKSHESQLISNMNQENNLNNQNTNNTTSNNASSNNTPTIPSRSRLHTEPGFDSSHSELEKLSPNNLTVPRSPATPNLTNTTIGTIHNMGQTAHRFTKKFKVMSACDFCNKQMFFGLKCKECKYRCHKDCESQVQSTCSGNHKSLLLDDHHSSYYSIKTNKNHNPNSPNINRTGNYFLQAKNPPRSQIHTIPYNCPDSSSAGSSCNSSSPSSPQILPIPHQPTIQTKYTQFNFPDISQHHNHHQTGITLETHPIIEPTEPIPTNHQQQPVSPRPPLLVTQQKHLSNDSDITVSTGSTSASTDSDRTPIRLDSTEERDSVNWPRQNSLSLKEWDIPYENLQILEVIGKGRFGIVHRALWHGDVAVKLLKEDYLDDERTLEAFKLEVATFKKTRHENVVLFMGACMKPPCLAIVTSLCKGNTLYTHIHLRKDKFNLNRTILVAQQISQGMGYLHARGIVHKDLKTKNIFLENGKVIITDFGLFSATKLCYCEFGLGIPQGWLCYLAPELICRLKPSRPTDEDLPFSKASDVYAFGTVWYELLCGEFPFKSQSPEAIIWQVGRGMKQTLANLQASRDVKDILMLCWSFNADDRPDFARLLKLLEYIPKRRLARSPSHPVQLSKSAESVF